MIGARSVEAFKRGFFDRQAVQKWIEPKEARFLESYGKFVRRSARSSIRYTKKAVSKPGQPPRAHTKDAFASIKNILYAFDPGRKSVVVGPVKLNLVQGLNSAHLRGGTVPQALEFGGTITVVEKKTSPRGKWRRADMRRNPRPWETFRTRTARIAPRPFMGPAAIKERTNPKLAALWRLAR